MDRVEGLVEALGVQVRVVGRLGEGDLTAPSACADWNVEHVLRHSLGVTAKFTDFARGTADTPHAPTGHAPTGHAPTGDLLVPDPPTAFEQAAADAARAWRHADLSRTCHLPFGTFSAVEAAGINLFDVLAHTWDVAATTGLQLPCRDELWDLASEAARRVLDLGRDSHHYGPALQPSSGASPRERFLSYVGRSERR